MKNLLAIVLTFIYIGLQAQEAHIKITPNEFERTYKILYSNETDGNVDVILIDASDKVISKNTYQGTAFLKLFTLKDLNPGRYSWKVEYGKNYDRKTYKEDFEIKSEKKLIKESISVALNDYSLNINVKEYNTLPMSIFLFDSRGEQLEYVFWEPTSLELSKMLDLTKYDAYEVKLEIMQQGDPAFTDTFILY